MTPDVEARIFIAEDNKDHLALTEIALRQDPRNTVFERAATLEQALTSIRSFAERGINVALLDANLYPGDNSGQDGVLMLREIRKAFPNVKVVGLGLYAFPEVGQYRVDVDVPKVGADAWGDIPYTIDRLLNRPRYKRSV